MKPLILIKHSLPVIREDIPAREWILSDEGLLRARRLSKSLISYHPEFIVSSTEPKARQTAEIVAEQLALEFHMMENLHEHTRSQSPHYARDDFHALMHKFFQHPDMLVFGNETANQALCRFQQAIDTVLISHVDKTVLVVTHGTVISLFVSDRTGYNGFDLWQQLGLPSFVVLDMKSKHLLEIKNLN